MTTTAPQKRIVRCGWCSSGDHEHCAVAIEMESKDGKSRKGTKYPWFCPCEDCARMFPGRTRCTNCKRYDVIVDGASHCADEDNCAKYRKKRRAENPAMQQIDEIRRELEVKGPIDPEDPSLRRKVRQTSSKAKEGKCLCCGEPTRGGKFLPGHDSRYVSAQAAAYDAFPHRHDEGAKVIYDAMQALGPALHAKWIKMVEKLRKKATDGDK